MNAAVFGAGQLGRERHRGGGQQATALTRVDAARGRGSAVENPCHGVLDGLAGLAAAQKLQMHVGRWSVGVDGAARRSQALRHELAAVGTLSLGTTGRADPRVLGIGRQRVEERQYRAHLTVSEAVRRSTSAGLIPSHSASTADVSSPSAGAATAAG